MADQAQAKADKPTELERLAGWFDRRTGMAAPGGSVGLAPSPAASRPGAAPPREKRTGSAGMFAGSVRTPATAEAAATAGLAR